MSINPWAPLGWAVPAVGGSIMTRIDYGSWEPPGAAASGPHRVPARPRQN